MFHDYICLFNLRVDSPVTVLELAQTIIDRSGRTDLEPLILSQARDEIQEQYLSSEKARRVLGWRPRHSLIDGLQQTIHWYREFLAG